MHPGPDPYRRRVRALARRVVRDVVDLWIPPRCAVCGAASEVVCGCCLAPLAPADRAVGDGGDGILALLRYDDASRPIVAALKFEGRRDVARVFGPALARLLDGLRLGPGAPTVTWAPTTDRRRRTRGYDQAEVLARVVAESAGLPVRRLLGRSQGPSQTGRTRLERLDGVEFDAHGPSPTEVVVCDDVLTTGATLGSAVRALRCAGAERVTGLVLARTPRW